MRGKNYINRLLDVIHSTNQLKIDVYPPSLAELTLTGGQHEAIAAASLRRLDEAKSEWGLASDGSAQGKDTCSLTPPHAPERTLNSLLAPELYLSPLARYLSEDNSLERISLGLSLAPDSVSFDCEYCGKTFTRASDLTKHTKYHTKPLSCSADGCDSSFGTKRDLDRHTKSRHETKRDYFFCPHLGCERAERGLGKEMGFTRRDHLQQHIRQRHKDSG